MIKIIEKVGGYEVLANSTVLVFKKESIELTMQESGLQMKIEFIQDTTGITEIKKSIEGKMYKLSLCNYIQSDDTTFGISTPTEVGKWEGTKLYFNFCGNVIDKSKGVIVFNYSFWKSNE